MNYYFFKYYHYKSSVKNEKKVSGEKIKGNKFQSI